MAADPSAADLFHAWEAGDVDERPVLAALTRDLALADALIKRGEGQRALLRRRIEAIVAHLGGKVRIDGVAEYRMTEPCTVVSYEKGVIEEVLHAMVANGDGHYAVALEAARKVSERPGTLQIRIEKKATKQP